MSLTAVSEVPTNLRLLHNGGAQADDREPEPGDGNARDLRRVAERLRMLADRVPEDRADIVRTASDLVSGIADTL